MRFDRSRRVLLVSPSVKDRAFHREGRAGTEAFYHGLTLGRGEKAFYQHYVGAKLGWMTVASKAGSSERAA